jgi:hypothetical protein
MQTSQTTDFYGGCNKYDYYLVIFHSLGYFLQNAVFHKLDSFSSSYMKVPTQIGALERPTAEWAE